MYHPPTGVVKEVSRGMSGKRSQGPRRVTIQDVAKVAGVSAATVSRALQGDEQISERTRTRVTKLAQQLGYVRNEAARSLVLQHTAIVALIIPDMADPVYGQIANGFEQVVADHDHKLILSANGNVVQRERDAVDAVVRHRVAGIALLGSILRHEDVLGRAGDTPCVFIDAENVAYAGYAEDASVGSIRSDDASGMEQVARHLSEHGYRKIAYASGPDVASNLTRRSALEEAASSRGLDLRIVDGSMDDWRQPRLMVRDLVKDLPDAVVCYDDKLALAIMNGLRDENVSVPDDVAMVGFDDIPFAAMSNPRLTTVAQPSYELGRQAGEMLMASLHSTTTPESRVLPVDLIVRESTPPRA